MNKGFGARDFLISVMLMSGVMLAGFMFYGGMAMNYPDTVSAPNSTSWNTLQTHINSTIGKMKNTTNEMNVNASKPATDVLGYISAAVTSVPQILYGIAQTFLTIPGMMSDFITVDIQTAFGIDPMIIDIILALITIFFVFELFQIIFRGYKGT